MIFYVMIHISLYLVYSLKCGLKQLSILNCNVIEGLFGAYSRS